MVTEWFPVKLRVVLFCHSLVSCWSHGSAHFLRGICRELLRSGHEVSVWEPQDSWSRTNLESLHGASALDSFAAGYPDLSSRIYDLATLDLDAILEWNDAELVRRVGEHRLRNRSYRLLFHDTHQRSRSSCARRRCSRSPRARTKRTCSKMRAPALSS
jgi:hypothetical protein